MASAAKNDKGPHDLANRARALRQRIFIDEDKLAKCYPDQEAELEVALEQERAMLAEVEEEVVEAEKVVSEEARQAIENAFASLSLLLRLRGHLNPAIKDGIFTRCYLSAGIGTSGKAQMHESVPFHEVKAALLNVLHTERAPLPSEVRDRDQSLAGVTQRNHTERVKNERAGRGHFTDDELRRERENPQEFRGGRGARRVEQMSMPAEERS